MERKKVREWFVDVHWGKIALISWGDAGKTPALLVHGYMDSAATFSFLVEHLPDTHYYVAFDLPGHGKSDPLPLGPLGDCYYYVEVVRAVVDCCMFTEFVYLAHSLGFVIGMVYNNVYPCKISRMINIVPALAIDMVHYMSFVNFCLPQLYELNYAEVDQTKDKKTPVFLSREHVIRNTMRRRKLTEKQAEIVLSRSLVAGRDGTYRLSWSEHAKLITTLGIPVKTFYVISTSNPKPMLLLHARDESASYKDFLLKIEKIRFVKSATIDGGHDIHITNPEDCAKNIKEFLNMNFNSLNKKSKM